MQSPSLTVLVDAAIGLAVIVAGVVLLCFGKIDGQTGIALIGAGAALASGSSKAAIALRVPAPPQLVVTPASSLSSSREAATEPSPPPAPVAVLTTTPPPAQA